jgi:hypothetical protein
MSRSARARRASALLAVVFAASACGRLQIVGESFDDRNGTTTSLRRVTATRSENTAATAPRLFPGLTTASNAFAFRQRTRIDLTPSGDIGVLDERYHYLAFGTPRSAFEGGLADDRGVVLDHIGQLLHVSATQATPSLQAIASGDLHVGASWLAVLKPTDRSVPWIVAPADPVCFPTGTTGDCFDMQSFSRTLFTSVANAVEAGVRANAPDVRVAESLLHAIPNTRHAGMVARGAFLRAQGVGFVYELRATHPLGTLQVFVPIHFIFADDRTSGYRLFVDPLALPRSDVSETLPGVLVKGVAFTSLAEGLVRDAVVSTLSGFTLPSVNGVGFEVFVLTAINATAGNPRLFGAPAVPSPGYDVLLLPESLDPTPRSSTLWTRQPGAAPIERRPMRLVFLE